VTFLDVGQGNAALVRFPGGKKMLIDGGGFGSGDFDVGKAVVAPFLWHNKIGKVDYLVLSHPEADHMNGLRFIAKEFQPEEFWHNEDQVETQTFQELMGIIKSGNIKEMLPADLKEGVKNNGALVEILHPMSGGPADSGGGNGSRLNNHSLVLRITFAGKSFLFPGDLEKEGEKEMLANTEGEIRSHVLLAPHHGSKTSSSKAFLERVRPELCVVSAGKGVWRNFPHPTVEERLLEMGCRVLTTSKSGAVTIRISENDFEVETFLQGKLDNLALIIFPDRL
jgi:competence protein ComEC